MASHEHLEAGGTALRAGRWADARSHLEAALEDGETPEVLEALADACWWLCDGRSSVAYRERAWVGFREAGDVVRAGRTAVDLSIAYLVNLGNEPAARGWLGRAQRVLRKTDPNPLQGWLWLMEGYMSPSPASGRDLMARALQFAQASGDVDLELVSLSDLGLALVVEGRVDEGLTMLDEAMAGTLGGEYHRLDTVVFASCSMLAACHLAGDLERADEWCRVADDFMHTYGCPFLYARCRTHYGGVLVARGRWAEAELQLVAALEMSQDAGPGPRMNALAQLGDLRLRQGRVEEAEALLAMMDDSSDITLAAAALRMARDQPAVAATLLERRARLLGESHIEAAGTLAMLVEAHIGDGDLRSAAQAAERLRAVAEAQDRGPARALSAVAAARIAGAGSRRQEAIEELESAVQRFAAIDLPLEGARARLDLARLLGESRPDVAVAEATRALDVFAHLGASSDANAAAALLRRLGAPARTGARTHDVLTEREREVLALVAMGLSNPEIAQRLYISRKTASNHVSNILAKLGLRNRAEAVAYAARQVPGPPAR